MRCLQGCARDGHQAGRDAMLRSTHLRDLRASLQNVSHLPSNTLHAHIATRNPTSRHAARSVPALQNSGHTSPSSVAPECLPG